jgi:uncharacterized membrane protein
MIKVRKIVHKVFDFTIFIKAVFGVFEILSGIFLAVSGQLVLNNFIIDLAREEIAEDPNDLIANFLINTATNFYYDAHLFAIIYLIGHGIINIFLAVSLFKGKIWAYFTAMAAFGGFIIYQLYRYFHTFSPALLLLSAFDAFLVLIIWLEYLRRKKLLKDLQ